MNEALVGVLGALAGAAVGGAIGYFGSIRNAGILIASERSSQIEAQKKGVIGDLVAYRFVLASDEPDPAAKVIFNAALGRAAVEFSHCKRCMDEYRSLGEGFTAEKFYSFISALMDDVPLNSENIDRHLLENVPARR